MASLLILHLFEFQESGWMMLLKNYLTIYPYARYYTTLLDSCLYSLLGYQKINIIFSLSKVDAHNVIPLWVTSGKLEYAARTIRPKVNNNLTQYLTEFPAMISHPHKSDVTFPDPFENMKKLMDFLEIDKTVEEVDWAQPGEKEALKVLKTFLDEKIRYFDDSRNDPNKNVLSNLSPWFHFGQISVARCVLEVKKSPHSKGKDAFIEEAVVRRELADNFCYYNENYDNIKGAYEWAQKTLNDHRKDVRKPLYNLQQFETAKTHDALWNAAQNQLRIEGKMHGFLRMYWAKKILEWSESPEKALEIAILLNDKYNLDGRDPNGFVGKLVVLLFNMRYAFHDKKIIKLD